jgi:hypothetical protein
MGAPRTLNDGIELNLSESQASLFSDFLKAQHWHEKGAIFMVVIVT